jgi:hypothetical protein
MKNILTDQIEFNKSMKGSKPRGCFAAGTLIHTKEGLKPIETIQVGDWVLSYPDDQRPPDGNALGHGCDTYRQVTQVFVKDEQPLCQLIVANLASGNKETIWVTPNHPIYLQGRGWTPVSEIEIAGDCLENYLFGNLIVFRCFQDVYVGRVYNFEVDEFHTFYVGEAGIWVHDQREEKE